ncbi:MAG: ETC complex I subunit [Alphaproteobacteria bacterium]|nr:ETC complex I subunit [Alphaproteobacteria bacterium]
MQVRVYKPSRSTMQAGLGATRYWILEYPPEAPRTPDPLMGWTSARDTRRQIRLRFESLGQALDFARGHGLEVDLEDAHAARRAHMSYADNFACDRLVPWSH